MRIENAVNEVWGPKSPEQQRDAEVKRRRSPSRSSDVVQISNAARAMGSQTVSRADLESTSDVRQARVEEVRERVASGYYNRPDVQKAVADAVLNSGVVDGVGQEAQQARSLQQQAGNTSDVRPDQVAQAKQRVATAYYDSAGVRTETADRVLGSLTG